MCALSDVAFHSAYEHPSSLPFSLGILWVHVANELDTFVLLLLFLLFFFY